MKKLKIEIGCYGNQEINEKMKSLTNLASLYAETNQKIIDKQRKKCSRIFLEITDNL